MLARFPITRDLAANFDDLSVAQIKHSKLASHRNFDYYMSIFKEITDKVGEELITEIITSREYKNLIGANEKIFNALERVRAGDEMRAIDLDRLNDSRFAAKKELQKQFGGSGMSEIKTNQE